MSERPIITERQDDVFIITLNRPDRLNALSDAMLDQLLSAVDEAERVSRALLITGGGRAFCSGADLLSGDTAAGVDIGRGLETGVNPLLERLADLSIPVVTAVNGPAAGAGAGLALAGDFALMAESSYLLLAFINVGLVPDCGLTWFLPRLVGRQRAMEMMMLGERMPAARAHYLGLIYRAVPDDALLDESLALTRRLAGGPTVAYSIIRRNMRLTLDTSYTETLRAERVGQREAGDTRDFAEGVAAFGEKRKPVFSGK